MLNRAMNYLKRKRNEKEDKREPTSGETSQAIVPYGSKVLPYTVFQLKSDMMKLHAAYSMGLNGLILI